MFYTIKKFAHIFNAPLTSAVVDPSVVLKTNTFEAVDQKQLQYLRPRVQCESFAATLIASYDFGFSMERIFVLNEGLEFVPPG
jgi:hypothetical protein